MNYYQMVRQFYTYIRQELHVEQACVNIQCSVFDELCQVVMDALAFDGAMIYEGDRHEAEARIVVDGDIRYYLLEKEVDPSVFVNISEWMHGTNAVIEKDKK